MTVVVVVRGRDDPGEVEAEGHQAKRGVSEEPGRYLEDREALAQEAQTGRVGVEGYPHAE